MRVPVEWLEEYIAPGLSVEELATRLAMTGTEVGRVERAGVPDPREFVIGKVLAAERHPDADRLTVCEVDVSCFNCTDGYLRDGSRCTVCRGEGWVEILGAGMVDPNVFGYVADNGYDPERVQGFAFGMGIERIAMLKHAVPDLRLLYDNDVRFLEQFG